MTQKQSLSVVGSDNQTPPPPAATPPDNPRADKPDNRQPDKPRIAGSVAVIVLCVLVALVGLVVYVWGWWGLLVGGVITAVVYWVSYWWWNVRKGGRSASSKWSKSKTSRSGTGHLPGKAGTSSGGTRGGIRGRLPRWLGGTRDGKSSRTTGRKGSFGMGRGTTGKGRKGLFPGRGSALGGPGRGTTAGTGRSGRGTPSPGRSRRRHASRMPVMASLSRAWDDAGKRLDARAEEKQRNRDRRDTFDAALGALDRIGDPTDEPTDEPTEEPTKNSPKPTAPRGATQGETRMSAIRSRFEQLAEELPQAAQGDEITSHDLGLEPLLEGYGRSMPHIADAIKVYRERIQTENFSGNEGAVLETLELLEKSQRANANIADEALRTLRASPTWQALQERVNNPRGHMSDVNAARQNGYL